ncbi:MAG: DMT family transporter [Anaerolineales bacterium]
MHRKDFQAVLPYLGLGIGVLSLGFSAIFVRLASAPGPVVNAYRMGIATLLLGLPFARNVRSAGKGELRAGIKYAVLGGIFFAVDLMLWSTGVVLSGATNPTLMANTAPLWVGLGASLFLGEKRGKGFWTGVAVALIGSVLILGQDALQSADFGLGTFLGLVGSFFYGGYFIFSQKGRSHLNSVVYFWVVVATATVVLLLFTWIFNYPLTGYTQSTYLNFLALGIIVQVVGWFAINFAQGYLPAAVVSPTLLGQPVVTALVSGSLLGERLSVVQGVAGVIVLGGVYMVHNSRFESKD